jgi:serine protease inhibitor
MAPFHCLWTLSLALAAQAQTADTSAAVVGRVRSDKKLPLQGADVFAIGGKRLALTDQRGGFSLRGLTPGRVLLRARAIGFAGADTVLLLHHGARAVWNPNLKESEWAVEAARNDSIRTAAGGIDSAGLGLVSRDTARSFTYERFGVELLRAAIASSSPESSRVLSPLSVGQALALALGAARDSTAIAIASTLHAAALDADGLAARNHRFSDQLRTRRDVTLRIGNALWVDTSATLQPAFQRWARDRYGAIVRSQPLRVPQVIAVLNRWADSVTQGTIPAIRDVPFAKNAEVALTNAVYFKGRWLEPFDTARTQSRPFTAAGGERLLVPTMERTTNLAYRRESRYQVVRVPYAAGLTAMEIVLPDSGVSATGVLAELARSGWPRVRAPSDARAVQLRLPRLRLAQATNLQPPLTELGLGIVFDSLRADFTGLVVPRPDRPPPCPPLSSGIVAEECTRHHISEAVQSASLDVSEEGTEAAAATTIGFAATIISVPPPPIRFFVDRPFLFAIRDERTGTLLFVGYIAAPSR